MPNFGDVIYSPTSVVVAPLNADNSYGTAAVLEYVQKVSFEPTSDSDSIKAYGMEVEGLAILTSLEGTIEEASLDWTASAILTGFSNTSSGVTPNQAVTQDALGGGSGYPYFGLIVTYAATNGAAFVVGFPKCKITEMPGFEVEQNKFRTGEISFKGFVASVSTRKFMRQRKYESASNVPTFSTAGAFDTFLGTLFA